MKKIVLAAAFALTLTPAWAIESGANPGTVVGNVYQDPLAGCGYGYGKCPSGYGDERNAPRHHHRKIGGRDGAGLKR